MSENSVTNWMLLLKSGDEDAAQRIWERYFERMCDLARKKLGTDARRAQDEQDVTASAIFALYQGAVEDRFRKFENRDDLWQVLSMIVARKASNVRRSVAVRNETGECDLGPSGNDSRILQNWLSSEPTPDSLDSFDVHCQELLDQLDDKIREVALLRLSGFSNAEIAQMRKRSVSTIERYLQIIRQTWEDGASEK
jgi:DNA-directed RNA polymerase specialized sigma24 family protein